jgi:putative component of membrane protein insertase Oxa1/YidC/SpoIIIJ protein YidD
MTEKFLRIFILFYQPFLPPSFTQHTEHPQSSFQPSCNSFTLSQINRHHQISRHVYLSKTANCSLFYVSHTARVLTVSTSSNKCT